MTSLNKFRSKTVHSKSHKLHGVTLCAIIGFNMCEVINYTLDGVSIHPVTTKIQASFITQLPERGKKRSGISPW